MAQRFLAVLMGVTNYPCTEMRLFRATWDRGTVVPASQYPKTLGGWYDTPEALAREAATIRGVSAYVVANPIKRDLLAKSYCKLTKLTTAGGTSDDNIASLSWLYIDVDSKRAPDISATDEELAVATTRQSILLDEVAGLKGSAMWGCSGNGGWILVRLPDYPVDEHHRKLIEQAIILLSAKYSDERAVVDVKTRNPSRIMCLPGTLKCKGSDLVERPYRLVTLEGMGWEEGQAPPTFDLEAWFKGQGATFSIPTPTPPSPPRRATQRGGASVESRAREYVAKMEPAISGSGGHDQTFDAACALVLGFGLTIEQARPILAEAFNPRCVPPWSPEELEHKLQDAEAKGGERGYLLAGNGDWKAEKAAGYYIAPEDDDETSSLGGQDEDVPEDQIDNPHRVARAYRGDLFSHPAGFEIRYWMGEFHAWREGRFQPVSKDEMKADLAKYCEIQFRNAYNRLLLQWGASGSDPKKQPKLTKVSTRLVGDVYQALGGLTMLQSSLFQKQPVFLSGPKFGPNGEEWRAEDMLPCRNMLVHIPSYIRREAVYSMDPTPDFFSAYCLDFGFDPNAPEPVEWLKFLHQLWPDDPQSIQTLREWIGLQLVPVTSFQKIGCLIGPPRSGKGTIAKIIRWLVGERNCAGPTLASFSTTFGIQPLIGKLCAIIDDARLGPKSDHAAITERLLTISGEGSLNIDRKHKEAWMGTLTARITYISNELPRLLDSSTALANRLLLLRFTKSFLGKEDTKLDQKLKAELPGILLWALQGYADLVARGRFEQPESGDAMLEELEELASPISQFKADCLEEDEMGEETIQDVYSIWSLWCAEQGMKHVGSQADLGRALRSIIPNMETAGVMRNRVRFRVFRGFKLTRDAASFSPSLPSYAGYDGSSTQASFLPSSRPPF